MRIVNEEGNFEITSSDQLNRLLEAGLADAAGLTALAGGDPDRQDGHQHLGGPGH